MTSSERDGLIALAGYQCDECNRSFYVPAVEEAYVCPMCENSAVWAMVGPFQLAPDAKPKHVELPDTFRGSQQ